MIKYVVVNGKYIVNLYEVNVIKETDKTFSIDEDYKSLIGKYGYLSTKRIYKNSVVLCNTLFEAVDIADKLIIEKIVNKHLEIKELRKQLDVMKGVLEVEF
jgi:hypothetical protein